MCLTSGLKIFGEGQDFNAEVIDGLLATEDVLGYLLERVNNSIDKRYRGFTTNSNSYK